MRPYYESKASKQPLLHRGVATVTMVIQPRLSRRVVNQPLEVRRLVNQPLLHRRVVNQPRLDKRVVNQPPLQRIVVNQPLLHRRVVNQPQLDRKVVNQPLWNRRVVNQPVLHRKVVHQPLLDRKLVNQPLLDRKVVNQPLLHKSGEPTTDTTYQTNQSYLQLTSWPLCDNLRKPWQKLLETFTECYQDTGQGPGSAACPTVVDNLGGQTQFGTQEWWPNHC